MPDAIGHHIQLRDLAMPQTSTTLTPADRLAARICRSTNAKGSTEASPAIADLSRRTKIGEIGAALNAALKRGWLRRNGDAYVLTPAGAELGKSRSGKRTGRVIPF